MKKNEPVAASKGKQAASNLAAIAVSGGSSGPLTGNFILRYLSFNFDSILLIFVVFFSIVVPSCFKLVLEGLM